MVISKLHLDRIEDSLSIIQSFLKELKCFTSMDKETFLSDTRNPAAVESFLRRSLEAIFDVGRHIIAKSYGCKELEYKKIAVELGKNGVISDEYSKVLLKIAGYRNRMVHLYNEIEPDELYDIVKNHLDDIERFPSEIVIFIERYKQNVK